MPPKRKAAEISNSAEGTSTRATRSSARNIAKNEEKPAPKTKDSTATTKSTKASTRKKAKDDDGEDKDSEPPAKKAKTTKAKSTTKATKGKKSSTPIQSRDEPTEGEPTKSKLVSSTQGDANGAPGSEPYSAARALALFQKYTDDDDPSAIGPSGLENLCTDAKIPMEGAMPLILAWQLDAEEMGRFTKDEWVKGTSKLKISSLPPLFAALSDLENLLVLGKSPLKSSSKTDPYDRGNYLSYTKNVQGSFQVLYMFCFNLAKPEQSRNIDMETSTALWSVILAPKYPVMQEVIEFIGEKEGVYKATNKDLWTMMLEFCRTVRPDLQDYESDGAWPTLLDDFVAWKKAKSS